MPTTRALYIDDDDNDRQSGVGWHLERAFDKAFAYAKLDLEPVDFDDGERLLQDAEQRFDLVFIDVLEKVADGERKRGIQLISRANENGAATIAVSQDPQHLGRLASAAGAHEAVAKRDISEDVEYRDLRQRIKTALKKAGITVQPAEEIEVRCEPFGDVRIQAVVGQIGKEHLVPLIVGLSSHTPDVVELRYVRAGFSGATVLQAVCRSKGPQANMLLKLSRDPTAMRDELAAWQDARQFGDLAVPSCQSREVEEAGGWYAIAIDHRDGRTFSDWYVDPPATTTGEQLLHPLEQLFLAGGLPEVYSNAAPAQVDSSPSLYLRDSLLTLPRRARIELGLERLQPLAEHHASDRGGAIAAVRTFMASGRIGEVDEHKLPQTALTVLAHADLHGRNLLVDRQRRTVLLDPADVRHQHWAADWARLTVDLLLSGLATNIVAHEWSHLDDWRDTVRRVVTADGLDDHRPADVPHGSWKAVRWLRTNVDEIFGELDDALPVEWELRTALAVELLRGTSRREDLPAPVRVLALLAAGAAFDAAAEAVPNDG